MKPVWPWSLLKDREEKNVTSILFVRFISFLHYYFEPSFNLTSHWYVSEYIYLRWNHFIDQNWVFFHKTPLRPSRISQTWSRAMYLKANIGSCSDSRFTSYRIPLCSSELCDPNALIMFCGWANWFLVQMHISEIVLKIILQTEMLKL